MPNIDWSKMVTVAMREAAILAEQNTLSTLVENSWVKSELVFIADQLLAIEDDDPTALPGTDREWRDYRIQVRAWKEGQINFPDKSFRPTSPTMR